MLPKSDISKIFANINKHYIENRIDEFHGYVREIESKFDSDKNNLSDYYNKAINGLSDEERMEVDDYFSDDYYIIEEVHIYLYRKSILICIYSFLENSMYILCHHLYSIYKYPVKVDDLKGDGIVRAKEYLEKLASVDFSELNKEWSNLIALNKIRNCIVHSEGDIESSKNIDKLKNIINNSSSLSLKNDRYIKIEKEFINFCIDQVESFLKGLHQKVFK